MCQSPNLIKNPNFGNHKLQLFGKDTVSKYLSVPCGHCNECIAVRQMNWVQRVQMESLENYVFFCTLTYNDDSLPIVTTSTGYDIRFADVSDVQKMFKRLRKSNAFGRPFRHFSVSELGSKKARPHFHILFLIPKYDSDDPYVPFQLQKVMFDSVLAEWRRNYGSTRKPIWKPLCTYVRRFYGNKLHTNFDLHYVIPFTTDNCEADVAFYVLKYMMKPSERSERLRRALHLNLSEEEYESIWSLVKPRHFESECFGFGRNGSISPKVLKHLKFGIASSKGASDYALYVNPVNGKTFPLARYYKSKSDIYSIGDHFDFYYGSKDGRLDNVVFFDKDLDQSLTAARKFRDNVNLVDLKSDSNFI